MKLHVITDGKKTVEELVSILSSIHPDVDYIHIREKHRTARELIYLVQQLLNQGVPRQKIIINDRVDVAHALTLGGVQLAYHSIEVSHIRRTFPEIQAGCSVHSYEDALQAAEEGADFILYGHVYSTLSKEGLKPKGLEELKEITASIAIPVIAIGGIKPENAEELKACGASGIAVMSGIMDAKNYAEAAKRYKASLLAETEVYHEY